jgi:proteasome lid subunit RPN8/RPN11
VRGRLLDNPTDTGRHVSFGQTLEIDDSTAAAIVQHLRAALPNEGCGLLATVEESGTRRVVRFYPGENIDRSATRFTMDPRQVMAAMDEIEARGWRLGGIVHSHPRTPATPSPTDLREAYYPEALLVIASFTAEPPVLRAWRVCRRADEVAAVEVRVTIGLG